MNSHLLRLEIVDKHVVKLLGDLENASEDIHLAAESQGDMAAAGQFHSCGSCILDLCPLLGGEVELPKIFQLVIVFILASEDENAVALKDRG